MSTWHNLLLLIVVKALKGVGRLVKLLCNLLPVESFFANFC